MKSYVAFALFLPACGGAVRPTEPPAPERDAGTPVDAAVADVAEERSAVDAGASTDASSWPPCTFVGLDDGTGSCSRAVRWVPAYVYDCGAVPNWSIPDPSWPDVHCYWGTLSLACCTACDPALGCDASASDAGADQ